MRSTYTFVYWSQRDCVELTVMKRHKMRGPRFICSGRRPRKEWLAILQKVNNVILDAALCHCKSNAFCDLFLCDPSISMYNIINTVRMNYKFWKCRIWKTLVLFAAEEDCEENNCFSCQYDVMHEVNTDVRCLVSLKCILCKTCQNEYFNMIMSIK